MEENFSMEWNIEWKIFRMEWKKIASLKYGKIIFHFIPYHALPDIDTANIHCTFLFIKSVFIRTRDQLRTQNFEKGGGRNFRIFEKNKDQNKKLFHPKSVRFFAQN